MFCVAVATDFFLTYEGLDCAAGVQHMLQSNMCIKDTEPIPGCCLCVGYGQRKLGESQRFKDRCHLALACGENTVSCNCWLSACCVGEGFFI